MGADALGRQADELWDRGFERRVAAARLPHELLELVEEIVILAIQAQQQVEQPVCQGIVERGDGVGERLRSRTLRRSAGSASRVRARQLSSSSIATEASFANAGIVSAGISPAARHAAGAPARLLARNAPRRPPGWSGSQKYMRKEALRLMRSDPRSKIPTCQRRLPG